MPFFFPLPPKPLLPAIPPIPFLFCVCEGFFRCVFFPPLNVPPPSPFSFGARPERSDPMLSLPSSRPSKATAANNLPVTAAIIVVIIEKKEKTANNFLTIPVEEGGVDDGVCCCGKGIVVCVNGGV